jgi:hypothetical protein
MSRLVSVVVLSLGACNGSGTIGGEDTPELLVAIASPVDGATSVSGDEVQLSATVAWSDGSAAEGIWVWTAPEFELAGNNQVTTDLPVGSYALTATAVVGETTAQASVDVTVEQGPVEYGGAIDAKVDIKGGLGDYTVPCDGRCFAVALDYGFTIEGRIDGGVLTGTMLGDNATADQAVELTGSMSGDTIEAAFDRTWTNSSGSLRIYGTWSATPVVPE